MAVNVALCPVPILQIFNNAGAPNAGGSILTQVGGVNYPTYQDAAGTIPLPNPVPLNSRGEVSNAAGQSQQLFLQSAVVYTFTIYDSNSNQIDQATNVTNVPSVPVPINQGGTGATTLAGAQTNLAIPFGVTTGETLAGVTPTNTAYPAMHVDRYFTNLGITTDAALAFSTAFLVAQKSLGGVIRYGGTQQYYLNSPVNFTTAPSTQCYPVTLRGTGPGNTGYAGCQLIINHSGHPYSHGFDLTGTEGMTFEDVSIGTLSANPNTAIFQARNSSGSSVGITRFINCGIEGKFTVAAYYNYGAEDDALISCYMLNGYTTAPAAVCIWTSTNNKYNQTSSFQTVFSGSTSTKDHEVFGGQYFNNSSNVTGVGANVFYLDAIQSLKVYGPWVYCSSGVGGGQAIVYMDTTNGSSDYCVFRDLTCETSGANIQNYGIYVSNDGVCTPTGWVVDGWKIPNLTYAFFSAGSNPTMDNWYIANNGEIAGHANGLHWSGTIQYSVLNTREMLVNAGTLGIGTVFIGDTAQLSYGTLTGGLVLNSRAGTTSGWGTPTGGAVINNYSITDAGGASSNTNKCVAEILTILKSCGLIVA